MRCPYCAHNETQVVETRESDEGDVVRRRRRCLKCDKRVTTYERADIALPAVVKKDGSRAEFDPAKVRSSMMLALRKRPVSVEQIDAAIDRIQDKLLTSAARELPSLPDTNARTTAYWIRSVLAGESPVPSAIAQQVELILDLVRPATAPPDDARDMALV